MAMNFRRARPSDEPEINLIPFIDVLLVVIIFLMLSTTYSKFTELQVRLPQASADQQKDAPAQIVVSIGADGRIAVDKDVLAARDPKSISTALLAKASDPKSAIVVISADANAAHQYVITAMEAARMSGISQITFAAQLPSTH
jgi:biopolymer transport protein ExbD